MLECSQSSVRAGEMRVCTEERETVDLKRPLFRYVHTLSAALASIPRWASRIERAPCSGTGEVAEHPAGMTPNALMPGITSPLNPGFERGPLQLECARLEGVLSNRKQRS